MRFSGAAPFESALYDTLRSPALGSIRGQTSMAEMATASNFRLLACRLLISLVWHLSSLVKNYKRSQSARAADRTSVRIVQDTVKFLSKEDKKDAFLHAF